MYFSEMSTTISEKADQSSFGLMHRQVKATLEGPPVSKRDPL